ncbi:HD domain-containing protein, partial [bacterium]|nr:HD domain-containing protein [bacterium]
MKRLSYNFHEYAIRDPIHGFIGISELERKIIDTEIFQRLRRIKQLALAYLVYPGALHTRFEHSLGVLNIAGKIAEKLFNEGVIKNQDNVQIIRLAALLHDLGHGPFSH